MILELDIGNTRAKWRLCSGIGAVCRGGFLVGDGLRQGVDGIAKHIDSSVSLPIEKILVSSVLNREKSDELSSLLFHRFFLNPLFAVSSANCGRLVNGYSQPERLGVDRWLAMIGASGVCQSGFVVVDCGSAITVDAVASSGAHLGGYIAPGVRSMRNALSGGTDGVNVGAQDFLAGREMALGRDTQSAVMSACAAMLQGLIAQSIAQLRLGDGSRGECAIFATGGDSSIVTALYPQALCHPELVLDGLAAWCRENASD